MTITSSDLAKLGITVPGKRPSKYRNVPTIYRGQRYVSKAEADYAAFLDGLVAIKAIWWWIKNGTGIPLGVPENRYVPDFLVVGPETTRFVDVKGVRTAKFQRDCRLWKAYGPCPLSIVSRSGKGWKSELITP